MATVPQRLIATAEAAKKAGAKTGRETADYFRKHEPALAKDYISHVHLAHKMLRKPQFGPAIDAVRKGAQGTLSAIAKPYQAAPVPRGNGKAGAARAPTPRAAAPAGIDARLAAALGLDEPEAPTRARKRRADPAPHIADAVFEAMVQTARKGTKK
jgi:hypothetical protein